MDIRNNILYKNKLWVIILVAQFLLFYILSKFDFAIAFFSELFEWKKTFHILLFSEFGFSFGDLIYIILFLLISFFIIASIKTKKAKYVKFILFIANIFYFIYQCFWGMLYFQKPIIEHLPKKKITDAAIKELTLKYLDLCKSQRETLNEDRNGIFKINDYLAMKKEILLQQKKLPELISSKKPVAELSIKPSQFSSIMNKTGILGYYNPFTSEAQYNPNIPATQLPFTLAHEMSHQLGFAREQEASFIAFICARNSRNANLRYSANLYALKSLLRAISRKDKKLAQQIISNFSDKMKRDRNYELSFILRNEGIVNDFFGITNDLFLKSNQQEGSITYSYFVNLLILNEI